MKAKPTRSLFILSTVLLGVSMMVLRTPTMRAAGQQQDIPGQTSSASLNWAGYVAGAPGPYTSVTGSWVVPTIVASGPGRADATWVGIGGVNSLDLLQAGTEAMVNDDGSVTYQAWYETLPNVSIPVSLAVSPGDSMTATLSEIAANRWQITIRDNTTNKVYAKTVLYDSSLSSAEWIEERVSDIDGSFWPLDNFGSVKFFNAFATQDGQQKSLTELGAQPLTMVSGRQVLATTSGVDSTGSFTVARGDTPVAAAQSPTYAPAPDGIETQTQPQDVDVPTPSYIVITFGPDGVSMTQSDDPSTQTTNVAPTYIVRHHHTHSYYGW